MEAGVSIGSEGIAEWAWDLPLVLFQRLSHQPQLT